MYFFKLQSVFVLLYVSCMLGRIWNSRRGNSLYCCIYSIHSIAGLSWLRPPPVATCRRPKHHQLSLSGSNLDSTLQRPQQPGQPQQWERRQKREKEEKRPNDPITTMSSTQSLIDLWHWARSKTIHVGPFSEFCTCLKLDNRATKPEQTTSTRTRQRETNQYLFWWVKSAVCTRLGNSDNRKA